MSAMVASKIHEGGKIHVFKPSSFKLPKEKHEKWSQCFSLKILEPLRRGGGGGLNINGQLKKRKVVCRWPLGLLPSWSEDVFYRK